MPARHATIAPMIRAYHCIITAYGFWLPNDPRVVVRLGTTMGTARLRQSHESGNAAIGGQTAARLPEAARSEESLTISGGVLQWAAGAGGRNGVQAGDYRIGLLCACLFDSTATCPSGHRSMSERAEQIIAHLKGRATQQLAAEGLHPLAHYRQADGTVPSPWARKAWPVFLDSDQRIAHAIEYVENNPRRDGKPPQRWSFVTPFVSGERFSGANVSQHAQPTHGGCQLHSSLKKKLSVAGVYPRRVRLNRRLI